MEVFAINLILVWYVGRSQSEALECLTQVDRGLCGHPSCIMTVNLHA
jgi:hypothetical protein